MERVGVVEEIVWNAKRRLNINGVGIVVLLLSDCYSDCSPSPSFSLFVSRAESKRTGGPMRTQNPSNLWMIL
jgi:hypothetical protein